MFEEHSIEVRSGLHLSCRIYRGTGAPKTCIFMAHANSLCQDTWVPTIEEFRRIAREEVHIVTWDHRSHGHSGIDQELPYSWVQLGLDTLKVVDWANGLVGQCQRVAIGHSMGCAAIAVAELERPGTFNSMLFIEPVLTLTPPPAKNSMAEMTMKRKATFESYDEVRANYATKPAFRNWDPRCMEAYLQGGFARTPQGVTLRCPPWAEAEYYYRNFTGKPFGELRAPHVAFLVAAETSFHRMCSEYVLADLARASHSESLHFTAVPDVSHFLPQEKPALAAQHVLAAILVSRSRL